MKITPAELAVFLKAFNRIATTFSPVTSSDAVGFRSPLLNSIIYYLPTLREAVKGLIGAIHLGKAAENDKIDLWTDPDRFPAIEEAATVSHDQNVASMAKFDVNVDQGRSGS
jgi:DNA mismatch repair protein MSH3